MKLGVGSGAWDVVAEIDHNAPHLTIHLLLLHFPI